MKIINYIVDSFVELNTRVTWMTWTEVQKSTVVVAVFSIIFAIAIFFTDKFFQFSLDHYFNLF